LLLLSCLIQVKKCILLKYLCIFIQGGWWIAHLSLFSCLCVHFILQTKHNSSLHFLERLVGYTIKQSLFLHKVYVMWQLLLCFETFEQPESWKYLRSFYILQCPKKQLKMSLNLFPKAVFLIVLLSYLKATEEFKATHSDPHPPPTVEHSNSFKQRFKERFRRSQSQPAVWEKVPETSGQGRMKGVDDGFKNRTRKWIALKIYHILARLKPFPPSFQPICFNNSVQIPQHGMNVIILSGFNPPIYTLLEPYKCSSDWCSHQLNLNLNKHELCGWIFTVQQNF